MRFDFFELIESIFKGFVFFVYNFLGSIWDLVRRPRLAPARLYRAYLQKDASQIGSLTLLFAVLFVAYSVINSDFWFLITVDARYNPKTLSALLDKTGELAITPPTFDMNTIWGGLLGALLATVAIDATARLWLKTRAYPVGRKSLILSGYEYSLIRPILILLVAPLLVNFATTALELNSAGYGTIALISLGIMLLGLILAVMASRRPIEWLFRGRASRRLFRQPPRIARIAIQLILTIYVAGAVVGGGWAASKIDSRRKIGAQSRPVYPELEAIALDCALNVPQPYADTALVNLTPTPIVIYPRKQIEVSIYRLDKDGVAIEPTTPVAVRGVVGTDASFQTLSPNETRSFRFMLDIDGPVDPTMTNCSIRNKDHLLRISVETLFLMRKSAKLPRTDPYWQK